MGIRFEPHALGLDFQGCSLRLSVPARCFTGIESGRAQAAGGHEFFGLRHGKEARNTVGWRRRYSRGTPAWRPCLADGITASGSRTVVFDGVAANLVSHGEAEAEKMTA